MSMMQPDVVRKTPATRRNILSRKRGSAPVGSANSYCFFLFLHATTRPLTSKPSETAKQQTNKTPPIVALSIAMAAAAAAIAQTNAPVSRADAIGLPFSVICRTFEVRQVAQATLSVPIG
jgi:hypothetical protein